MTPKPPNLTDDELRRIEENLDEERQDRDEPEKADPEQLTDDDYPEHVWIEDALDARTLEKR